MKKYILATVMIAFLLVSCSKTKQSDLLEIPVDVNQSSPIPLSEITENMQTIDLELTDENMFSGDNYQGAIVTDDEIFIATYNKMLVFGKSGKFIRTIGSQGQGPREYTRIDHFAVDKENKRLFIDASDRKILSYDFNGNFLTEKRMSKGFIDDINYIDKHLLLVVEQASRNETTNEVSSRSVLYKLNNDLQTVDSCLIRDLHYMPSNSMEISLTVGNHILEGNNYAYLYYGKFSFNDDLEEKTVYDTLYRYENNRLIPELRLSFKNSEFGKYITVFNIYRSSRYVFAQYRSHGNRKNYHFYYDTKAGKSYNMQQVNGYIDDINQIKEPVRIYPFKSDTEKFYYLHTNIKPDDLEEPNPTLYIGTLKK